MTKAAAQFDFRTRGPGPHPERFVASLWYARGRITYT